MQAASSPRIRVLTRWMVLLTRACMPPDLPSRPMKPPRASVNTRMLAFQLSATVAEAYSIVVTNAVIGFPLHKTNAPTKAPANSERISCFVAMQRTIATSGGSKDKNP